MNGRGNARPPRAGAGMLRSLLAATISMLNLGCGVAADTVQAIVYADGQRTVLSGEALRSSGLVEACESQLISADNVLRLAVFPAMIDAQRRAGLAVEVVYPAPRTFTLAAGGRSVQASRLLVPLTGELAGEVTTIFVGSPEYQAGPFRNRQGTVALAILARAAAAAQR